MVYGESCVYDVAVRAGEGARVARPSNKYRAAYRVFETQTGMYTQLVAINVYINK